MRILEIISEDNIGTSPKRPSRPGSRPSRGHEPQPRYKTDDKEVDEGGPASRALCLSNTSDEDLGASQLASCKSQGLRARDGKKSHLIGHGKSKVRIVVGGKKIKGKAHGGPLPDYGTRKDQR